MGGRWYSYYGTSRKRATTKVVARFLPSFFSCVTEPNPSTPALHQPHDKGAFKSGGPSNSERRMRQAAHRQKTRKYQIPTPIHGTAAIAKRAQHEFEAPRRPRKVDAVVGLPITMWAAHKKTKGENIEAGQPTTVWEA
jgi:hypothetical protein